MLKRIIGGFKKFMDYVEKRTNNKNEVVLKAMDIVNNGISQISNGVVETMSTKRGRKTIGLIIATVGTAIYVSSAFAD